ncbi:unnamed protein product [Durusdinium trenchii]|uniref:FAD/NAD(P)-binding domain-containing protein n=1 Tax=Durusdinium trenchii TaxID=1381693 RepID=A0ABP0K6P3_9DINO
MVDILPGEEPVRASLKPLSPHRIRRTAAVGASCGRLPWATTRLASVLPTLASEVPLPNRLLQGWTSDLQRDQQQCEQPVDGALNGLDIELGFVAFTQVPLPDCSHVSGEFRPRDSICPQDFDQDFVLLTAVRYPAMPPPPGAKKMPSFQLVQAFEVYWATRKVWLKAPHRRVLLIGGQFTGNFCARELKKQFYVTVVDCKEYFEYTPGVLRAFVRPAHLDSLTFTLQPVYERKMGVKFIWGEVKELNGARKTASVKTMFSNNIDEIGFDYCIICSGCNFGPFKPMGESLWFPTVHEEARGHSDWKHIDERYLEGRRRHVLEEYHKLTDLNKKQATVLIVGAGFIGVEWATELEHFFPQLKITIIDFLPRCLGPLPDGAADYCSDYMAACGIKEFYNCKYDPKNPEFWKQIELPNGADEIYVCIGVKASNYFMPAETLSDKGPGGGGWIHFNKHLQVTQKPSLGGGVWADGTIFAVGDCNYGCIGEPGKWEMPPRAQDLIPWRRAGLPCLPQRHETREGPEVKVGHHLVAMGSWHVCYQLGAS